MIILRSTLLLATLGCLGLLGYTGYTHMVDLAGVVTQLQRLVLDPWVQVLLASYYLGVLCMIAAVLAIERRLLPRIAWSLAVLVLTYPAAVFWLLLRGLPGMGERSSRRLRSLS